MEQNIKIIRKPIKVDDFHFLCKGIGWQEVPSENYALAISNSIACVHAVRGMEIVGFARLVGDKGMYLYVQDLIVDVQYQGQGIGARLMYELEVIAKELEGGRGKLTLISAHDVCGFYNRLGYKESKPESRVLVKTLFSRKETKN